MNHQDLLHSMSFPLSFYPLPTVTDGRAPSLYDTSVGEWKKGAQGSLYIPSGVLPRLVEQLELLQGVVGSTGSPPAARRAEEIFTRLRADIAEIDSSLSRWRRLRRIRFAEIEALDDFARLIHREGYVYSLDQAIDAAIHEIEVICDCAIYQDRELLLHTLIPREVAQLIVLPNGTLNYGAIPAIREEVESRLLTECSPSAHDSSFVHGLQMLEMDAELRSLIEGVSAEGLHPLGERLIRLSCALAPDQHVETHHVHRALVTALLSRVRQGSVGSCFATCVAIGVSAWEPHRLIEDLIEILQTGQMVRSGLSYPVQLKASEEDSARWSSTHASFMNDPAIIAACRSIGLTGNKYQSTLLKVTQSMFWGVSPQAIFEEIASYSDDESETYEQLIFAFETFAHDPLLECWEYTLAGMAETRTYGATRKQLNLALSHALKDWKSERKELLKRLSERARYLYDPCFRTEGVATDGRSQGGGFVLYDALSWTRIDSQKKFIQFLKSNVQDILIKKLPHCSQKGFESNLDKSLRLVKRIESAPFLNELLTKFDSENEERLAKGTVADLEYTPWVNLTGNFESRVMQTYFELKDPPNRRSVNESTLEGFLSYLIGYARDLPQEVQERLKLCPTLPIPVSTDGEHAFSLLPGHTSFRRAWTSRLDAEDFIYDKMIDPMEAISASPITKEIRERVLAQLQPRFLPFDAAESMPSKCTLKHFRKLVKRLNREDPACRTLSSNELDTQLYRALPKWIQAEFRSQMIHFADTNWCKKAGDLHLVIAANPWNGKLGLWEMTDESKSIQRIDSTEWIFDNDWLFYFHEGVSYCPNDPEEESE